MTSRTSLSFALALCLAACSSQPAKTRFGCYVEVGAIAIDGATPVTDTVSGCVYQATGQHVYVKMTGTMNADQMVIMFGVGDAHSTGSFTVVPWTIPAAGLVIHPTPLTVAFDDQIAIDAFNKLQVQPNTAMIYALTYPNGVSAPGTSLASQGGGSIQLDPASVWALEQGDFGHLLMTFDAVAMTVTTPRTNLTSPATSMGMLTGNASLSPSAGPSVPHCNPTDPNARLPGGASCVTFKACDTQPPGYCASNCPHQTCGATQADGHKVCCEQDEAACADDVQCCSGHCAGGTCVNAYDAMYGTQTKCKPANGGGTCTGGKPGDTCSQASDCCLERAVDPTDPTLFKLECVQQRCCRPDLRRCDVSSDCCAPFTCPAGGGFCG
jgi:hypothetical protein